MSFIRWTELDGCVASLDSQRGFSTVSSFRSTDSVGMSPGRCSGYQVAKVRPAGQGLSIRSETPNRTRRGTTHALGDSWKSR